MAIKKTSASSSRKQKRRALADPTQDARLFRAFLDGITCGVVIFEAVDDGEDFIIKAFNTAAERIEKVSRNDVLGKSALDCFPGIRELGLFSVLQQVWRSGQPERLPFALYKDDRLTGWRDNHVFPLSPREIAVVYEDAGERRLLEEQLAESEERWKFAIEGSDDGLWDRKTQTGEIFFSKRWKSMHGFEEHELISSLEEWSRRMHPDDRERVQAEIRRCLEGQSETYSSEYRVQCKDGSYIWVQDRGKVVSRTPDGKPLRMVGTHSDISERKHFERVLEESKKRLALIFRYSPQLFFCCTLATERCLEINEAFSRMLGHSREEAIGKTAAELGIWANEEEHQALLKLLAKQGKVINAETHLRCKDASQIVGLCSVTSIDIDDEPCLLIMGVDITALKDAELGMEHARQEAELANRAKSEFLAKMSHEIRTPINAIMGLSHLLLRSELNVRQRDFVSKIATATRSLLTIINDILDFSRIEAGKMSLEQLEFRVEEVLNTLVSLVTHQADAKGIELIIDLGRDVPSRLIGDSLRLGQVLLNLVGNAIKFTEQGEVLVSIQRVAAHELEQGQTATLLFMVQDTGIGIRPEELDRLFQSFSQADGSITRRFGGTGLGLAISQHLVHLMGGKITVVSEPGQGSTFAFSLSFPVAEAKEPIRPPSTHDPAGMKALVVDDNPTAGQIIASYLESFKFQAEVVSSGEQALNTLRSAPTDEPYTLLLLDWKMPVMDGIKTLERIKADDSIHFGATAILVTAFDVEDLLPRAMAAGFAGVLAKPVTPSTLCNAIQEAFHATPLTQGADKLDSKSSIPRFDGLPLLLVEDNHINQQVAAELLQTVGFRVDVADNGLEALQQLEHTTYAGVLMDIEMPGLDGYETTRQIRHQERFKDLPVIAMTAHALVGEKEKCLAAGMNDYTSKPVEPDLLFSILAQWIPPVRWERPCPVASFDTGPLAGLPDRLPGLNLRAGLTAVGENLTLYGDLLSQFLELYSDAATTLEAAIGTNDLDFLVHFAHAARGVASNLGMSDVAKTLEALEKIAPTAEAGTLSSALPAIRAELTRAVGSVHLVLKRLEALPPAVPSVSPLETQELLKEMQALQSALRNAEYIDEDLLHAILVSIPKGELQEQALLLKRYIADFAYEKAQEQLQRLANLMGFELDS